MKNDVRSYIGSIHERQVFDKSVGDIVCGSCIKMHATMQQRLKRQKNPPHFISCSPRSVQLVARNQESLMWRMTFGAAFVREVAFDEPVERHGV